MPKIIDTFWECPVCGNQNPIKILKPTVLHGSYRAAICSDRLATETEPLLKGCGSYAKIIFLKPKGIANKLVGYTIIECVPSARGILIRNRKIKQQREKLTNPQVAEETGI